MPYVVRCDRCRSKRSRSFVASVPWPYMPPRPIRHSDDALEDSYVSACSTCHTLYEIRRNLCAETRQDVA